MGMDPEEIVRLIQNGIPGANVQIEDLRGDGEHYTAHVTSPAFMGMTRIQQHQMVFKALHGRMGNELHALALTTAVS
jgi:stress-induced morphogen